MKSVIDKFWEDTSLEQNTKRKKIKMHEHELEELREHVDLIALNIGHNIGKVYQHAKDRTRKELFKSKNTMRKKFHHSYNNEKSG